MGDFDRQHDIDYSATCTRDVKYIIPFLLILSGCTTREIRFGNTRYKSTRIGAAEQIGDIEVRSGTNVFIVKGVKSDLVTGLGVVTEAAVKAAVKSAVPTP